MVPTYAPFPLTCTSNSLLGCRKGRDDQNGVFHCAEIDAGRAQHESRMGLYEYVTPTSTGTLSAFRMNLATIGVPHTWCITSHRSYKAPVLYFRCIIQIFASG